MKDPLDLPTIVEVIKEIKIGQGINFLPRTIEDSIESKIITPYLEFDGDCRFV